MALYSVKFEAISPLTNIPNSQTVFGTICTYYSMLFGDNELISLLKRMEKDDFPFIVSSMFYENLLPVPQNFNPLFKNNKNVNGPDEFKLRKKIKKIKYFSKRIYNDFSKNHEEFELVVYNFIKDGYWSIVNDFLVFKDEEKQFDFNIVKEYRTRVNVSEEQYYNDALYYLPKDLAFEFYIEIENDELVKKFNKMFKKMNYVSFGGHKSLGYNMFNFKSFEEVKFAENKNQKLLLSLSIGDETIDYDLSNYQLINLNAKFTNTVDKVNRKNIVAFKEGSMITTTKKAIGKIVKEINDDEEIYQNLVGLLV